MGRRDVMLWWLPGPVPQPSPPGNFLAIRARLIYLLILLFTYSTDLKSEAWESSAAHGIRTFVDMV